MTPLPLPSPLPRRQHRGPGRPGRVAALALALAMLAALAALAGCSSGPPTPEWQLESSGSVQRAVQALLAGEDRVAATEFERARGEVSATGRAELLARVELTRCAALVASLQFEPCTGFERLRQDAGAAEQAYADHLRGQLQPAQVALLPPAQQALARAGAGGAAAEAGALQATADPLSRLLGAALALQAGRASPALVALAVDTASAQGWRRPLVAWLRLQQRQAELAGQAEAAARLQRRIELVLQQGRAAPP